MKWKLSPKNWTRKRLNITLAIVVAVLGLITLFTLFNRGSQSAEVAVPTVADVKRGSLASSTLLTGSVKAASEQYVYYDSTIGRNASVLVSVGDQVWAGQQLVQYDSITAQANYDTALRAYNKAVRDRDYFATYGSAATTAAASSGQDADGEDASASTAQQSRQTTASNNLQLRDYNDAIDNAYAELLKAQEGLNQTGILSDVNGTVVEVADAVDPASKESQTLVHVTSEGQYQIQGTLTEFDLPNIAVGQEVKITSKVYPNQTWTGKVSYVSNYPKQASAVASSAGASTQSGSQYDYKVDLTSPIGDLKQGFNVSLEVVKGQESLLVPLSAVTKRGNDSYVWVYDESSKKISAVKVETGNADAKQEEITSGLQEGQKVVTNPDKSFKDGQTLEQVATEDTQASSGGDAE